MGRLPPSVIAVMMGLGAAVALTGAGCERDEDDSGSGGDGDSDGWPFGDDDGGNDDGPDDGGYPSAVSTYGVGPSTTPSSSSSGLAECTAFPDVDPCSVCLAENCCDEGVACNDSQECVDFRACIDGCGPDDLSCATACQQTYPQGFPIYQALYQCGSASCVECGE
jgi:hypothetical protein